ncbi:hypothetical protein BDR26DRAFT_851488 [Obelidium mucronatum]|nr:hypothetical protein BDR26DRAFT_851488 [Obelidium mucronatum]
MSRGGTTLFCAGFGHRTRARDLAYEFERYGRLVRCDIPAPKSSSAKPFAFVEFEDPRDAEDAFYDMQGIRLDGYPITLQWAKQAPTKHWRYDGGRDRDRGRSRSPPPPRRARSRSRSPLREFREYRDLPRDARDDPLRLARDDPRDDRRDDPRDDPRDNPRDDPRLNEPLPLERRSPSPGAGVGDQSAH